MKLNLKKVRGEHGINDDLILSYNTQQAAFAATQQDMFANIEQAISKTDERGKMPLWDGYDQIPNYATSTGPASKRKISQVRTGRGICQFYAWLAAQKKPSQEKVSCSASSQTNCGVLSHVRTLS